jgi:hypothetical protein
VEQLPLPRPSPSFGAVVSQASLPFFTGDEEEEEDPYNQEIKPGQKPPPVRPKVQVRRAGSVWRARRGLQSLGPVWGTVELCRCLTRLTIMALPRSR